MTLPELAIRRHVTTLMIIISMVVLGSVALTHVKPVSPAGDANLAEGDVILEVNGVAVASVDELQVQMKKAPKGKYIRLYVQRGGGRGPAQKFLAAVKPE